MRGVLIALTFVVAACGDHGIAVVVTSGVPGVEAVRLYVGTGSGATATLTNNTGVAEKRAQYWTRDPGNEADLHTAFKDKTTFYYETDIGAPAVIAVGYDGQGTPIAAGAHVGLLPSKDAFAVTAIELAAVGTFVDQASSPVALSVWSTPTSTASVEDAECAGIVTADGPVFVVRDQDQDCDGNIDGNADECTPDTYLGTSASATAGQCLLMGPDPADCRIGGAPCSDKNAPQSNESCVPSDTCLPSETCSCVGNADPYGCALGGGGSFKYHCNIVVAANQVCGTSLDLPRPPTGGYACETQHGAKLTLADAMQRTPSDKLQIGNLSLTADLDGSASCAGSLEFSGTPPTSGTTSGLVTFPLVNNGSIAIPIDLTFGQGDCVDAASACTLDMTAFENGQTRCVARWAAPTTVPAFTVLSANPDPTFNQDMTEIFFSNGSNALVHAIKSGNTWSASPSAVTATAGSTLAAPELSDDGKLLVVTEVDALGKTQLVTYSRASTAVDFAANSRVAHMQDAGLQLVFQAATFVGNDGTTLIASAGTAVGTQRQLYQVALGPSSINSATPIDFGVSASSLDHPHLDGSGTQLYFDFTPLGSNVSLLSVASRRSTAETFSTKTTIAELASGAGFDPWVNDDGTQMYFIEFSTLSGASLNVATRGALP